MCLDFVITVYFSMVPTYSVLNTFTPEVIPNNLRSIPMGWMNVVTQIPAVVMS